MAFPNILNKSRPTGSIHSETVTIANNATASGSINLTNREIVGILFPSSMVGTTVGFQVSSDNSSFSTVNLATADIAIAKQNSKYVALDNTTGYLKSLGPYLKLISSASESGGAINFTVFTIARI